MADPPAPPVPSPFPLLLMVVVVENGPIKGGGRDRPKGEGQASAKRRDNTVSIQVGPAVFGAPWRRRPHASVSAKAPH